MPLYCVGVPVFVDIRPDNLNIDESVKQQSPQDQSDCAGDAGVGCELNTIMEIAQRHQLLVLRMQHKG